MLDSHLKKLAAPVLDRAGAQAARLGADTVSVTGFAVGLAAIPVIASQHYLIGLAVILASRLIDALDGAVARRTGVTARGAFLDTIFDLIVFAGLPFAFALADPSRGLAASFFIFALTAWGASSVFAAQQGEVLFSFVGRVMEDTELTLAFAVACAMPMWFSVVAYIAGALCFLAAGARIAMAVGRAP